MTSSKRIRFALVLVAISAFLLVLGFINSAQWLDLMKLLATGVVVGHTVSHAVERVTTGRSPAPVDLPEARVVSTPSSPVSS